MLVFKGIKECNIGGQVKDFQKKIPPNNPPSPPPPPPPPQKKMDPIQIPTFCRCVLATPLPLQGGNSELYLKKCIGKLLIYYLLPWSVTVRQYIHNICWYLTSMSACTPRSLGSAFPQKVSPSIVKTCRISSPLFHFEILIFMKCPTRLWTSDIYVKLELKRILSRLEVIP